MGVFLLQAILAIDVRKSNFPRSFEKQKKHLFTLIIHQYGQNLTKTQKSRAFWNLNILEDNRFFSISTWKKKLSMGMMLNINLIIQKLEFLFFLIRASIHLISFNAIYFFFRNGEMQINFLLPIKLGWKRPKKCTWARFLIAHLYVLRNIFLVRATH